MRKIIDFHTHPLYDFHLNEHGFEYDVRRFKDELVAAGVSHACGSAICKSANGRPVEEYERLIPLLNRQAFEWQEKTEGFLTPGIHIHPRFVQMSCDEIDKAYAKNVRLIGELVPYMMGWKEYACSAALEIFEYAAERDMTVSMHPTRYEDMRTLAQTLPHLKIVYAHLTGDEEQLEMTRRYDNVHYDVSASSGNSPYMLRYALNRVGRERILYGSDYPGYNPIMHKTTVLTSGLTEKEIESVFYRNARRLLNLPEETV